MVLVCTSRFLTQEPKVWIAAVFLSAFRRLSSISARWRTSRSSCGLHVRDWLLWFGPAFLWPGQRCTPGSTEFWSTSPQMKQRRSLSRNGRGDRFPEIIRRSLTLGGGLYCWTLLSRCGCLRMTKALLPNPCGPESSMCRPRKWYTSGGWACGCWDGSNPPGYPLGGKLLGNMSFLLWNFRQSVLDKTFESKSCYVIILIVHAQWLHMALKRLL